jgi:hypothetical protein
MSFKRSSPHDIQLLTAWRRVLLEKLTVPQLVKKFPTFYGTRLFITAVTNARQLSLTWANLMPLFRCLGCTKIAVQVRGLLFDCLATVYVLRWGVVTTLPNPKNGGPPFVGYPRQPIQYIRSYPLYWKPFLHPQPEDALCRGDRDPQTADMIHNTLINPVWHSVTHSFANYELNLNKLFYINGVALCKVHDYHSGASGSLRSSSVWLSLGVPWPARRFDTTLLLLFRKGSNVLYFLRGQFDPWDYQVVSKRRAPVTHWLSATPQTHSDRSDSKWHKVSPMSVCHSNVSSGKVFTRHSVTKHTVLALFIATVGLCSEIKLNHKRHRDN